MFRKMFGVAVALAWGLGLAQSAAAQDLRPDQVRFREIYKELVETNTSLSVGSCTEAAAKMGARLKSAGFTDAQLTYFSVPEHPKDGGLVAVYPGTSKTAKPILLLGHLDVVEAKRADWTRDPFAFIEENGVYYGRGTSDMKDEDAAVAASLIRLKKENFVPDRDIIVMFSADEEVGLEQDGPNFMVTQKRDLVNAGLVMNPDGGSGEIKDGKRLDFAIETVQKTYMTFKMETANKGGHSSEPRPDNAIYQLASGLTKLAAYQFPYKTNATTRAYFKAIAATASGQRKADLLTMSKEPVDEAAAQRLAKDISTNAILHTTCVATMLKAGVQENALPSSASATIQCRVFPGETTEQTRATLEKVAGDAGIKVSLLEPVQPAPETVPDPKVMASITKVVHEMWGKDIPVMPVMAAGASDSIFTRAAGMPSYGAGGGWWDLDDIRAHGRDERDEAGNFYQTVEFTYRLMKELSAGS